MLRVERQNDNALTIARWLESLDEVEAVSYPLLDSHPDSTLARGLLAGGGGIVTFRAHGGDARAGGADGCAWTDQPRRPAWAASSR